MPLRDTKAKERLLNGFVVVQFVRVQGVGEEAPQKLAVVGDANLGASGDEQH